MAKPKYLLIDGCPVPYDVAPYVYLVLRKAQQSAASIYRGEDAKALLHKHGKHTQAEIHHLYPTISNPPGHSQHELRGGDGRRLEPWQVGVDSGSNSHLNKMRVNAAAASYGLKTRHPYALGVEGHHWQFVNQPRPNKRLSKLRVIRTRARLRLNR